MIISLRTTYIYPLSILLSKLLWPFSNSALANEHSAMFLFLFLHLKMGNIKSIHCTLIIKDSLKCELEILGALTLQNFRSNLTAMKQCTCRYTRMIVNGYPPVFSNFSKKNHHPGPYQLYRLVSLYKREF